MLVRKNGIAIFPAVEAVFLLLNLTAQPGCVNSFDGLYILVSYEF
jgi:hypothetical protein